MEQTETQKIKVEDICDYLNTVMAEVFPNKGYHVSEFLPKPQNIFHLCCSLDHSMPIIIDALEIDIKNPEENICIVKDRLAKAIIDEIEQITKILKNIYME